MVYFTYIWLIFLVNVNIPYQGHPNTSLEDTTRPKNKPKHLLGCTWMSIGNCKYTIWPNLYYSPTQISPENFRGFLNLTMQILSIGVWMGHFFARSSVDPQGRLPGNSPEFGRFDSTIKISDCPWNRFPPFPPPPPKKKTGPRGCPMFQSLQQVKHINTCFLMKKIQNPGMAYVRIFPWKYHDMFPFIVWDQGAGLLKVRCQR